MKRVLWIVFATLVLFVIAGLAVPHFAADRFGEGAREALESSLRRRVKIGHVEFNLFTGPGFTISEVVIWDDPALSAEPIIYAKYLTAIPRILPLFAGRLAFSSIRLEEAHINLGRTASPDQPARWNVEPLTRPALFQTFPHISVVSGGVGDIPKSRINFKIAGVKSVFYILIDSLEVSPPSSGNGPWSFRLEGEPARTDRPAFGFGSFVADGRWTAAHGLADINVRMERSEVSDMLALLSGHDLGIHGSVSGNTRIAGPLSGLKINGRIDVSGIHGWDQLPSTSQSWPLAIAGTWDLPGQLFELSARLAQQPNAPVNAHFRVADYLGVPHWGVTLTCQNMPLQPLVPLARQVGLAIPDGVQLNGTLDGAVSFSRDGPSEGSASIANASLAVSGSPPLSFEDAQLLIGQGHARLAPSLFRIAGKGESVDLGTIDGDYDLNRRSLKVSLISHGMDIDKLRPHAQMIVMPVLRDLRKGIWRGQLTYSFDPSLPPDKAASWTGNMEIQHSMLSLPALAEPIRIAAAHAELDGAILTVRRMQVRAGDIALNGEYRYEIGAIRPHRFHLTAPRLAASDLENLLRPTLYRGGRVMRALGLNRGDVPDWLTQIHADGNLDIASLDLGGYEFDHLTTRVIWDGPHIKLAAAKARVGTAQVNAIADADLTAGVPSYHVAGGVTAFPWKGGKVDADLSIDTAGAGFDTLANLRADGSFRAHGVDADYTAMDGCFQFNWAAKTPRIKLTSLQVSDGEETYVGSGGTAPTGELVLDLAGVDKPVRLSLR